MVCVEFLTGSSVNDKIVDIKFSAHDTFLEYPSSGILNIEILESPMIYAFTSTETLSRNERGGFGALKSDSTHHFFRNACTKSGSLLFSQFSGC